MAKSYLKDQILPNVRDDVTVVTANIAAQITTALTVESARFADEAIDIRSNIPEGDENAPNWAIGQTETGEITFTVSADQESLFTSNAICIVAVWGAGETAQETGEPTKQLQTLFILALPTIAQMRGNKQLTQYIDSLLERDTLAKARGLARKIAEGKEGYSLTPDPVGLFLSATQRAASMETAFNRMYTLLQDYILRTAQKAIDAQKARGNHAAARRIAAVYSRARLNKATLKACLSSQMAAAQYFPEMVNNDETRGKEGASWDNILRMLITLAPKFAPLKIQKDAAGQNILDENGKPVRAAVQDAQSPAIFAYWLENRYETEVEVGAEESVELDFGAIDM